MKIIMSLVKSIVLYSFFLSFLLVENRCKEDDSVDPIEQDSTDRFDNTPFNKVPDIQDIVMYEVNFRAFSNSGTINGFTERLDSIKDLGVNVIWLMPVYPIGEINSVNSPYSVKNYCEVNSDLGTLNDLRTMVSEAHEREMAVILDWVANHTAWDNPWIEYKDWYTQDGAGNIISPAGTGWLDVADLDYSNFDMRLEMISSMKYWITEANIDGFRCDAADMVPYSFWKQAIDSLNNMPDRNIIFLAEGTRSDHFSAGFQLSFGWDFNTQIRNVYASQAAGTLFTANSKEYQGMPAGCHRLRYITNHDIYAWEGSVVDHYGNERGSVAAFVIVSFLQGVPLIYNGQEIAYPNTISFFNDNPLNWNLNPGIYSEYKNIMLVRKNLSAVRKGIITSFTHKDIVAFKKTSGTDQMLVLVNVRNSEVTYTVPTELINTSWKNALTQSLDQINTQYIFAPYEYLILQNR